MEERSLVASKWKSMDRIRDRAPPPKEWLPDAPKMVQYRRVVERRCNRGRDGVPGPCGSRGTVD